LFAVAVPCHSILVLFADKLMEPALVTLPDAVQKIVAFNFVLLQHLRGICFCVPEDVFRPLASEEPILPTLQTFDRSWTVPRLCCSLPCHILDCYTTILADDLIRLSFVSVSSGGSRATNRRLPGDVCVPVCKVLYPSSDIDSVHSGFVICTLKSILHIRCGGFHLYKQSCPCTLPKRGVASRFIALKCDRGTRAVGLILMPV